MRQRLVNMVPHITAPKGAANDSGIGPWRSRAMCVAVSQTGVFCEFGAAGIGYLQHCPPTKTMRASPATRGSCCPVRTGHESAGMLRGCEFGDETRESACPDTLANASKAGASGAERPNEVANRKANRKAEKSAQGQAQAQAQS